MGILVFILTAGLTAFAQERLSPMIDDLETLYPKNKEIFLQCLNKLPSRDKSHGCVDSYKYLRGLCDIVQENKFERRYNPVIVHRIYNACKLAAKGDNRLPAFFALDAKSCVQGFETLSDRLMSYNKNKELIEQSEEEKFSYMYEKNSCKDYRTYVNFCNYVDGSHKTLLPKDNEYLPQPEPNKKPSEICKPSRQVAEGLYTINHDLSELLHEQKVNAYDTLILKYRSRLPAGASTFAACEQVRAGYMNYGCAKFEKFWDGEPAWISEEDRRNLRKSRHDKIVNDDSENQN